MLKGSRLGLFWVFGITFVVVMVIQFIELPNGSIFSTLVVSNGKWNAEGSLETGSNTTSFSDFLGNSSIRPKTNDTVENVMGKNEIQEFSLSIESNPSSVSDPQTLTIALAPATYDSVRPVESVDSGISSIRNDARSKFKTDVEKIPTKENSALTHNISPQSDNSSLHKLSISEMTELLLQSHFFPNVEVCKMNTSYIYIYTYICV